MPIASAFERKNKNRQLQIPIMLLITEDFSGVIFFAHRLSANATKLIVMKVGGMLLPIDLSIY
jgi:hypothetical protein